MGRSANRRRVGPSRRTRRGGVCKFGLPSSSLSFSGTAKAHHLTVLFDIHNSLLYRVNMTRSRHPKKEVESALHEAESAGWTVARTQSGHRWGVMRCGQAVGSECRTSIWSTPRSPGNHAKQLRRFIARCPHRKI